MVDLGFGRLFRSAISIDCRDQSDCKYRHPDAHSRYPDWPVGTASLVDSTLGPVVDLDGPTCDKEASNCNQNPE